MDIVATRHDNLDIVSLLAPPCNSTDRTPMLVRTPTAAGGMPPQALQPAQTAPGAVRRLQALGAGWRAAGRAPCALTDRSASESSSSGSGGGGWAAAPPPSRRRRRLQPCWASQRRQRDPSSYTSMDELRAELEREGSDGPVTGLIKWLGAAATSASSAASPLQVGSCRGLLSALCALPGCCFAGPCRCRSATPLPPPSTRAGGISLAAARRQPRQWRWRQRPSRRRRRRERLG